MGKPTHMRDHQKKLISSPGNIYLNKQSGQTQQSGKVERPLLTFLGADTPFPVRPLPWTPHMALLLRRLASCASPHSHTMPLAQTHLPIHTMPRAHNPQVKNPHSLVSPKFQP